MYWIYLPPKMQSWQVKVERLGFPVAYNCFMSSWWWRLHPERWVVPRYVETYTWRIIPGLGYVVNNHGDRIRPLRIGLFCFLPNGRTSWLINGCDPITTYIHWDDPPSRSATHVPGSINSHYFHIIGDGHQPNSRGLYTHYKDSVIKGGRSPIPQKRRLLTMAPAAHLSTLLRSLTALGDVIEAMGVVKPECGSRASCSRVIFLSLFRLEKKTQTNKQTNKQTIKQTNKQTTNQTNKQKNNESHHITKKGATQVWT